MSDIFQEVDEDLRRDKAIKFWERYQYWFLGAAVLVVAGTSAFQFYKNSRRVQIEQAGAQYEAALSVIAAGKSEDGLKLLQDLARGDNGYATLAKLRSAELLGDKNPADGASALDALVSTDSLSSGLADVAQLRAAYLLVASADPVDMRHRLEPFLAPDNAYRPIALELLALSSIKAGDIVGARELLDQIIMSDHVLPDIRQRAENLAAYLATEKEAKSKP